jgi:hypothetical protein
MIRVRIIFLLIMVFAIFLSSCTPGIQYTLPPDVTLIPGTDIPQQVATIVSNALTQTAMPPATSTAIPGVAILPVGNEATFTPIPVIIGSSAQTLYQSPSLGIQFSYPSTWYLRESSGGVTLTSFDPSNPPHKLEWTDQTTSMQFGFMVLITPPASFDVWVESARQKALADQLSIFEEERFLIANQPAHRLSLVSGSRGIIHRVLTDLSGRYFEINIEGNFNLAKAVLDSIQPFASGGLKPPDSDTPAAGICGESQGNPVSIVLGVGPDGIPLAGRCIKITPAQRIKLINQSNGPFDMKFAEYYINLPVGSEMLLDQPVGQYLALGVHVLPMGPELWVKEAGVVTAPPPIVPYENHVVGYRLGLPGDWLIDENGMVNGLNKEVTFYPPNPEPFIAYLSINLDFRTLDQIINLYAQSVPDANREDTIFNGYPGIKYTYTYQNDVYRIEYYIPYGGRILLIATDRPNDGTIQSILLTVRFTAAPQPVTYEATMADNGRTFVMNVGDKLRLNVDLSYGWSAISISNPAVIAGAGDGYFAFTSGTATLTTTGNPQCLDSTPPCGMPSIMFTITVIVQ